MWDIDMTLKLKNCSNCGENNWEEFEKPHGAPYYRCLNCGEEYMAVEVEYYIG